MDEFADTKYAVYAVVVEDTEEAFLAIDQFGVEVKLLDKDMLWHDAEAVIEDVTVL